MAQLSASLLSGTQEFSLALAHLKFDFSLIKMEAPVEYKGLGQALSEKRKNDAEDGTSHITARKLGALFEDANPEAQHVFQAYGRRVTEIAQSPHYNPKGSSAHGPFAEYVGADGTTIWAAATSGKGAIAMHLLACLLARIWKASEAISIWMELVARRKDALREQSNTQTFQISALTAAQVSLTETQLAEWDASARAWLRTADEAKKTQQTQVMLILKNISLPITPNTGVYSSVMAVWTKALSTLELLIQGMPQRVQDGEVLLGLSSWHLYPDICALGATTTHVRQHDPLIGNGGIVTVGLHNSDPERDDGIYWSLPLTHLRYYGDPVTRSTSAGDQASRVSIEQLLLVTLGSVMSTWGRFENDLTGPIEIIDNAFRSLGFGITQGPRWVQPIAIAIKRFKESHGHEREALSRLVHFGIRRCPDFIAEPIEHPPTLFGLGDMSYLIGRTSDIDSKLKCLRNVAEAFGLGSSKNAIIRYFVKPHTYSLNPDSSVRYTRLNVGYHRKTKRTSSGTRKSYSIEKEADLHWLHFNDLNPTQSGDSLEAGNDTDIRTDDSEYEAIKESIINQRPFTLKIQCPLGPSSGDPHGDCEFVYGDPFSAAVFQPVTGNKDLNSVSNRIELTDVPKILPIQASDLQVAGEELERLSYDRSNTSRIKNYFQSLTSMRDALDVYERLPGATTSLQVTSKPVFSRNWSRSSRELSEFSLAHAFACIAMFETGELDLDPANLGDAAIMAMSYSNSIYVAERMISDPTDVLPIYAIRRIIGNIGRPGLSLLVPPQQLKAPKLDFESWNMVNHTPFDGRMEDNFAGTSLHLSFSEYQLAVNVGTYGQRHQEAFFVEAIVSVYDRGRWVADIDIMKTVGRWTYDEAKISGDKTETPNAEDIGTAPSHQDTAYENPVLHSAVFELGDYLREEVVEDAPIIRNPERLDVDWMAGIELPLTSGDTKYAFEFSLEDRPSGISGRRHDQAQNTEQDPPTCNHSEQERKDLGHLTPLASIDSWAELVDPPLTNAIVRVSENKYARLCTASVAIQQGFNLHIAKHGICW